MVIMRLLPIVSASIILLMTAGFRTLPSHRWDVSVNQPTIWLELDEELYAGDGFGEKVDNLDGLLESVKSLPPSDQRAEIWRVILDDFASVKTTFLKLRLKPGQIDAIDAGNAEIYDQAYADTRTIKVTVGSSRGAASGYASLKTEGSQITGCTVVLAPRTLTEPKFFAHVLSHEILHCLGLLHQQEDADSLMSYSNEAVGLGIEERMALTHVYPLDPAYAKETPTFGLSCAPAK
jgi:hypothetical protein